MTRAKEELSDGNYFKYRRNLKQIVHDFDILPIDETQWAQVWEPRFSGVKVTDRGDTFELTTSRLFLEDAVVEALLARHPEGNPLCSYLANSIATAKTYIPYSFVTFISL